MPQRVITASVGVAGLVVIGLGVASATVWKADDVLVATAPAGSAVVTTAPGVLELGGDPVTVRATTAGGAPVVLAVGRENDVARWVGTDAHDEVTGLSSWHDLAVEPVEAGAAPAPSTSASPDESSSAAPSASAKASTSAQAGASAAPSPSASAGTGALDDAAAVADPTDSDLWVAQATGKGSAQLVWPAQAGRWSLVAVGTGGAAPVLEMSWPRVVTTPWLWPLVILGSLMVLAAAVLLGRDLYRRRTGTEDPEWHDVSTGTIALVGEDGAPLTRRQLREAELARSGRPRTGPVPRVATGSVPQVPAVSSPDDGSQRTGATSAPASASAAGAAMSAPRVTERPAGDGAPWVDPAADRTAAPREVPAAGTRGEVSATSPATAPTAAIPTTRRALRTGAIPAVPAAAPQHRDGKGSPAAGAAQGGPGTGDPARRSDAPRRTVSAPGWLSGAGRRRVEPSADQVASADLASAPTTAIPQASTAWTPVPSAAQGTGGAGEGARNSHGGTSAQRPTGTGGPPAASDVTRSAHRPAWLAPGAPTPTSAPAPAPQPDVAHADGGRPDGPAQAGSRADAWRRAWGLPAQPDDASADQDGSTTEGDR